MYPVEYFRRGRLAHHRRKVRRTNRPVVGMYSETKSIMIFSPFVFYNNFVSLITHPIFPEHGNMIDNSNVTAGDRKRYSELWLLKKT